MSRLLVTGAAGFIGSNFVHYWHGRNPGDRIVVVDALTYAGNRHNLAGFADSSRFHFVHGNICDYPLLLTLLREHDIDTIVHFAAESHVDRSIEGPDAFIETNVLGTHCLLKAAKQYWLHEKQGMAHRFHHVSTDEVYGTLAPDDPPFQESTPYAPNSPYAASKAASDHLVRAYHHTFGLDTTTSNCSNNYGPFHFPEKLIPLCLLNILRGKNLPIYGDGRQIRDWLHVDDHNRGIELVLKRGRSGETYNIGGNNEWANIDTVKLLCQIVDGKFRDDASLAARFPQSPCAQGLAAATLITYVKDRAGHDTRYAIDASRIMTELGYRPSVDFAEGLARTVQWFLDHEVWWQSILDGSYQSA